MKNIVDRVSNSLLDFMYVNAYKIREISAIREDRNGSDSGHANA